MLFHDPIAWANAEKHSAQAAEERALNENYKLRAELERMQSVCAEAYQMAGALGASEKALDNLWAAAQGEPLPHETFLPHDMSDDTAEVARLERELADARVAYRRLLGGLEDIRVVASGEEQVADRRRRSVGSHLQHDRQPHPSHPGATQMTPDETRRQELAREYEAVPSAQAFIAVCDRLIAAERELEESRQYAYDRDLLDD